MVDEANGWEVPPPFYHAAEEAARSPSLVEGTTTAPLHLLQHRATLCSHRGIAMTTELTLLTWTLLLAFVYIFASVIVRTRQYGPKWNAGPRDETMPPPSLITGRLVRAQANLFETLPLFIAVVLVAHVAGVHTRLTVLGAELYFWARVVYLPLYAFGVPGLRTIAFLAGAVGILMIVSAVL